MTTIPQRQNRQTDGQLALAIPRSARLRAVKLNSIDFLVVVHEFPLTSLKARLLGYRLCHAIEFQGITT